jgi:hypothetical protein
MTEIVIFECPGGCPPGRCDTKGLGKEGRNPCAHCYGTGYKYNDQNEQTEEICPRCKGDGLGGFFSTATCSKCGQAAIDRAMWEGP